MTDAEIDALPAVRRARESARRFYDDPAPEEGATHEAEDPSTDLFAVRLDVDAAKV